ncbi:acyl-CoA dehydrogenase family protein [Nocardia asteroides]
MHNWKYASVEELEQFLGDPADRSAVISRERHIDLDKSRSYPEEAIVAISNWGMREFVVPARAGGRLGSLDELFGICRSVARRDLTCALGFGSTFLSAIPVWLWGTTEQQDRVARSISDGSFGSFALTEQDYGSDVLASRTELVRGSSGTLRLTGRKWMIGNATVGKYLVVFVRSSPAGGPRGFSTILLEKDALEAGTWSSTAKIETMGLRGHDLSGIQFDDCPIDEDWTLGKRGQGLEQAFKTLQFSRTMVASLALGASDAALRIGVEYTRTRRLYGRSIRDIPAIRDLTLDAVADHLLAEVASMPAVRGANLGHACLPLWSAIVKYLVPAMVEDVFTQVAQVISAKSYLTDEAEFAFFDKMRRDSSITGIFEGTSHINLQSIWRQVEYSSLSKIAGEHPHDLDLPLLFAMGRETTWNPDPDEMSLVSTGPDPIVRACPGAETDWQAVQPAPLLERTLVRMSAVAAKERDALCIRLTETKGSETRRGEFATSDTLAFGRAYSLLFAASSAMQLVLDNVGLFRGSSELSLLMSAVLHRLANRMDFTTGWPDDLADALFPILDESPVVSIALKDWIA